MNVPPRRPHEPGHPWGTERWFCVTCGGSYQTENGAKIHCKNAHFEENPVLGEDFAQGWHIAEMIARWEQWLDEMQERAERLFVMIEGADDFLMECENSRG